MLQWNKVFISKESRLSYGAKKVCHKSIVPPYIAWLVMACNQESPYFIDVELSRPWSLGRGVCPSLVTVGKKNSNDVQGWDSPYWYGGELSTCSAVVGRHSIDSERARGDVGERVTISTHDDEAMWTTSYKGCSWSGTCISNKWTCIGAWATKEKKNIGWLMDPRVILS